MSVPCILTFAGRSFSLTCSAAGLLRCRLLGPSSVTRWVYPKYLNVYVSCCLLADCSPEPLYRLSTREIHFDVG